MRIRWKRIKKLSDKIVGRPVDIHLSTALHQLVAFLSEDKGQLAILINAQLCKMESDVAVAVSHELAHAKVGSDQHSEEWRSVFKETLVKFTEQLNIPRHDLDYSQDRLGSA